MARIPDFLEGPSGHEESLIAGPSLESRPPGDQFAKTAPKTEQLPRLANDSVPGTHVHKDLEKARPSLRNDQ
jgi:hypothetical protein